MENAAELELDFKGPQKPVETHAAKSWRGISVQYSRLKLPAEYEFKWDGTCHYLAHHDLVLLDGEMEVGGGRPITGGDLRDQMTFVPEGQEIQGWAKPADRMNAFTVVSFDPSAMHEELQAEFRPFEVRSHIYFQDTVLGGTMQKLATIMADESRPASQVYAETLGLTAALEMFRLAQEGAITSTAVPSAGQLSKSRQQLVTSYIAENLGRDLGLDELANLCGLTRFHFARAFKATFNEPPHQFVLKMKVEKAKHLLATTRLPISDIAVAAGFNGASQFARSFKAATGQTALEYRRVA